MEEKDPQQSEEEREQPVPQPAEEAIAAPPESPSAAQVDEASQKLAEYEKQIEYYKDLLLRKAAEFDNFKKRAEAETGAISKYARAGVIVELLPIVDDFERSMKLSKDRRESEAFLKGIELIYQKLLKFLETQGVRPLDSLGKEFDVQFHDALLQVSRNDVPPHTVIEEVEKGYTLDDRVLRHAKVIVSTTPPGNGSPTPDSANRQTGEGPDVKKGSDK